MKMERKCGAEIMNFSLMSVALIVISMFAIVVGLSVCLSFQNLVVNLSKNVLKQKVAKENKR